MKQTKVVGRAATENRPHNDLIFAELGHDGSFVEESDADDFEATLVEVGVHRFDARHLGHARAAPGGPKIDEHDLAAQRVAIELLAACRLSNDWHGLADSLPQSWRCSTRSLMKIPQ